MSGLRMWITNNCGCLILTSRIQPNAHIAYFLTAAVAVNATPVQQMEGQCVHQSWLCSRAETHKVMATPLIKLYASAHLIN